MLYICEPTCTYLYLMTNDSHTIPFKLTLFCLIALTCFDVMHAEDGYERLTNDPCLGIFTING